MNSTTTTPTSPEILNRWLPLVKWFLAVPHYVVSCVVLNVAAVVAVIVAWFVILFTGRTRRSSTTWPG